MRTIEFKHLIEHSTFVSIASFYFQYFYCFRPASKMIDICSAYIIGLALIGLISLALLFFDTFYTFAQFTRAILAPYFIPQEPQNLAEKYGTWARKYSFHFLIAIHINTSLIILLKMI